MKITDLFNLEKTITYKLFEKYIYPWEVLKDIKEFILSLGQTLPEDKFIKKGEDVWIAKSASVAPTACINGPCIIDEDAEIRHCAYIRGSVIIGKGAVVGNSTEVKNSIIFDKVQIPHYNYVGDSVLGYKSHLGAGALTSNVKSDKTTVSVMIDDKKEDTGLKKFGAMVGDNTEVGCHAVLCPGTVLGKNCTIYPLSMVRGTVQHNSIFKNKDNIVRKV